MEYHRKNYEIEVGLSDRLQQGHKGYLERTDQFLRDEYERIDSGRQRKNIGKLP
jgi:hypothetical protein